MNTEIVEAKDVVVKGKSSQFDSIIEQVRGLGKGELLKVTSETNSHLRNTLYQYLNRREIKDIICVSYQKEVFLKKA